MTQNNSNSNGNTVVDTKSAPAPGTPEPVVMDEYGRDAAERTVELTPADAEAVNVEVLNGKHQSYEDSLHYVLTRGFAEIKRQREAATKLAHARMLQIKQGDYKRMLELNPSLVADANFVNKMLLDLGLNSDVKSHRKVMLASTK